MDWLNTHLHPLSHAVSIVVEAVLSAVQSALLARPPYALIAIIALLCWASRDKRVERTMRPILTVMQTVPARGSTA